MGSDPGVFAEPTLLMNASSLAKPAIGSEGPCFADPSALFGFVAMLKRHMAYGSCLQDIWSANHALDRTRCKRLAFGPAVDESENKDVSISSGMNPNSAHGLCIDDMAGTAIDVLATSPPPGWNGPDSAEEGKSSDRYSATASGFHPSDRPIGDDIGQLDSSS